MNDKVYVVESSFGQYDDHYMKTEGIFTDPAKAEELKAKIVAEMAELKTLPEPEGDTITEEDYKIYDEWSDKHNLGQDFNTCYVKEYTLNERVK